jgi:hypothetical protein
MNSLQGFWQTNASFNEEAGLYMFTIYIGKKMGCNYPAYLFMISGDDEQTVLINEPTTLNLRESMRSMLGFHDYREFTLNFNDTPELEELLPKTLQLRFYPQTGKIMMVDDKKIYAVLFKNSILSEMERIKEGDNEKNDNSDNEKNDNSDNEKNDNSNEKNDNSDNEKNDNSNEKK